jgi:hypothetical protein
VSIGTLSGGLTVVIRRRIVTGQDRQGNDIWGWADVTVPGAIFAPKGSIELVGKTGDSVVTTDSLYLPAGTVLTPEDEVVVAGVTYQADGEPSTWVNPWTNDAIMRADLKRVTG